jgi:hypothetical protein
MRVIIAGSRYKDFATKTEFDNWPLLLETIKKAGLDITEVVCGMACGVDKMGDRWASLNNIPVKEMPANWNRDGKAAGPIRNREMAKYADAAIIIWDGSSEGTRNMIDEMIRHKKPYHIGMTTSTLEGFF